MYIADFETYSGEKSRDDKTTAVWLWSVCNVLDLDDVETGEGISSFFTYIESLDEPEIYFHNLKFDGSFVLNWLLSKGYCFELDVKQPQSGCYTHTISDIGVWYNIKYTTPNNKTVVFKDSLKKLPFPVSKLGKDFKTRYRKTSIDYERDPGYVPSLDDVEYCKTDTRVVAECLAILHSQGLTGLTIGSDCLQEYQSVTYGGKTGFRKFFPLLADDEDAFVRSAYRGGWCYVDPRYKGRIIEGGNTYDVNSLYPSMMYSQEYNIGDETYRNFYPYGEGVWYDGEYEIDEKHPAFIERAEVEFKLKDGYLPFIQLKNNPRFAENEHIVNSGDIVELTLTMVDKALLFDHYDVLYYNPIGGYKYKAGYGFFDKYIEKWSKIKSTTEGAQRQIAKLMLNNLYGKLCTATRNVVKESHLDNGVLKFKPVVLDNKEPVYTPAGVFVTAWARNFTIRHAQLNYDTFCYADTDSIHMIGEANNLAIHPTDLCCWKHEASWQRGFFIRQKTYGETDENGKYQITGCGMQKATRERLGQLFDEGILTPSDLVPGYTLDENTQLKPRQVNGGVLLYPGTFTLH